MSHFAVVRAAANVSTGTQDIKTTNLAGETPVAAILIACNAVTDATAIDGFVSSIGFTDGTNQAVSANQSRNGVFTMQTQNRGTTDEVVQLILATSSSGANVDGEANFDSWVSDGGDGATGITINWTNAPAAGCFVIAILFSGSDVSAQAGTISGLTQSSTTDITTNFATSVVFLGSNGASMDDVGRSENLFSFGVCVNDGSDTQRGLLFSDDGGVSTSAVDARIETDSAVGKVNAGSLNYTLSIGSFTSTKFTVTAQDGDSEQTGYLALKFANDSVWAGTVDMSSASKSGVGFQPSLVMLGLSTLTAVDTTTSDSTAGAVGISAFTANDEQCMAWASQDAQNKSNTQSLADNQAVNLTDDSGSSAYTAAFSSMDSDGWTLDTADSTAHLAWGFAVGAAAAAGGPPQPPTALTLLGVGQ